MKKKTIKWISIFLIILALLLTEDSPATAKVCKLGEYHLDIYQGKTFDENTVLLDFGDKKFSLDVEGELSDSKVQSKISEWANKIKKERCREAF